MNWGSVDEFLRMGGYGLYVWGSYLMTVVVIAVEIIVVAARHRAALRRPPAPLPERYFE